MSERRCPHKNIVHCPLYVAAHGGGGGSCVDAFSEPYACAFDQGRLDYNVAVAKLAKTRPEIVAECAAAENAESARQQQQRNMNLSGLH